MHGQNVKKSISCSSLLGLESMLSVLSISSIILRLLRLQQGVLDKRSQLYFDTILKYKLKVAWKQEKKLAEGKQASNFDKLTSMINNLKKIYYKTRRISPLTELKAKHRIYVYHQR